MVCSQENTGSWHYFSGIDYIPQQISPQKIQCIYVKDHLTISIKLLELPNFV